MDTCAYCGSNGPFTKEHILPQCLHARTSDLDLLYLQRAEQKLVGGEPTIGDVCARCNNKTLSALDAYICALYDRYFHTYVRVGNSVKFSYDFDQLTRSLLKVIYNSARAHNSATIPLSKCASYVLEGRPRPKGLAVLVQLVIPYLPKPGEDRLLHPSLRGMREVPPEFLRVSRIDDPKYVSRFGLCRRIGIRSYYFHVLLPPDGAVSRQVWRKSLRDFKTGIPGSRLLNRIHADVTLHASPMDALQVAENHLLDNLDLYKDSVEPLLLGNRGTIQDTR